ncbi:nucleoside-diphosphate kinase [Candidatus Woesearchaeota archaeon]|nr:nucleoside-diphosphate kinase [Candidatus Woesearchaeota archaeon]
MEQTLVIIKPDGVKKRLVGECLKRFEKKGFSIVWLKRMTFSKSFVKRFYSHLAPPRLTKKLFSAVVCYLSSGPVVAVVLEAGNAVKKARQITGPTDPSKALRGTIRGDYATDVLAVRAKQGKACRNIIHASGSPEEAKNEIRLVGKQ